MMNSDDVVKLSQSEYEALQVELATLRSRRNESVKPTSILSNLQPILSRTISRIRASFEIDEILQTTVEEVRLFLRADRVALFEFDPQSGYDDGQFVVGTGFLESDS